MTLIPNDKLIIENSPWMDFKVGGNKKVYVFRAFDLTNELIKYKFKCESYVYNKVPEIDDYQWIEAEDALGVVTESQIRLFSKIIQRRHEDI